MSNRKLIRGIIIGAAVGGLVTMFDRNTRNDVLDQLKTSSRTANNYVKNPSEAFYNLRNSYETISTDLTRGINSVLTILTQVQETLDSISQAEVTENEKLKGE
ncbi:YtxH domain-containing protein [Aquibacillus saliphilus]|uniref:YtxH domain-containing protein n=1 Tax=Aquibacillus saliphilus TaxID=1909422 RepID=UPI001CF037AA|nr:YtxH domain-containing protein [Aquibacillus saliphilus]